MQPCHFFNSMIRLTVLYLNLLSMEYVKTVINQDPLFLKIPIAIETFRYILPRLLFELNLCFLQTAIVENTALVMTLKTDVPVKMALLKLSPLTVTNARI